MRYLFVICLYCSIAIQIQGQDLHPRILVKDSDKEIVQNKIEQQTWARSVFDNMKNRLEPYVKRHQTEPEWILSRYLMNRVPGKRYTDFYCDPDGTQLVGYSGDAPVPTVRVTTHKRPPMSKEGHGFRLPEIEEIIPYDTSRVMRLQERSTEGKWEWVDPQQYIGSLNGKINTLALESSILYWLTGEEKYGIFAADILDQWAKGAYYQNPIQGACRAGYLCIQTLGDGQHENMILAYDFLYNFLLEKRYETKYYDTVFNKIAETMTFRGYYNNNWYAAQTSTLVYAALALEKKSDRDKYLKYVLEEDIMDGTCGRYCFSSTVEKWLTEDGHWKEPGGYHTYPVTHLLKASLALENNGYQIFTTYPAFFDASYVMLKYSYPNGQGSSFGDTGRPRQSPECLEIGIAMASKYKRKELKQLLSAMDILVNESRYKRENSGFIGLLCFVPEIPESTAPYIWPRSGKLDFAQFYLQRNGIDKQYGLMYTIQGASYNHNHANGMAMELYGMGQVMGPDPGNGLNYEDPMHVRYYARWAAHNTVVSAAQSSSVPIVRGGGGTKNIGALQLYAMEPKAEKVAVSTTYSFTDTRYLDISTGTNQQRTMAIIRTSDTSGYYLDIYRSDNKESNQYLYHNIGDALELQDLTGNSLSLHSVDFPLSPEDPPGFSKIKNYRSTGFYNKDVKGLFKLKSNSTSTCMQVIMPSSEKREFMSALAPASKTADPPYNDRLTPLLICYQHEEAWSRPFIAIYEPFKETECPTVINVEQLNETNTEGLTVLRVTNRDKSEQVIFQSIDITNDYSGSGMSFSGIFGVVNIKEGIVGSLYLGEGGEISCKGYSLRTRGIGAASVTKEAGGYIVSCNQETEITLPDKDHEILLVQKDKEELLRGEKTETGTIFKLPVCENAIIRHF